MIAAHDTIANAFDASRQWLAHRQQCLGGNTSKRHEPARVCAAFRQLLNTHGCRLIRFENLVLKEDHRRTRAIALVIWRCPREDVFGGVCVELKFLTPVYHDSVLISVRVRLGNMDRRRASR